MNKKLLGLIFAMLMCALIFPAAGLAKNQDEISYNYPVYNTADNPDSGIKEWKTGTIGGTSGVSYTIIDKDHQLFDWNDHWYVVQGEVEISDQITFCDSVNLILTDGCKLKVNGIKSSGGDLAIFGQAKGTGELNTKGCILDVPALETSLYVGIATVSGTVTINGGRITANADATDTESKMDALGIGVGYGKVTINDGTVTTTGTADDNYIAYGLFGYSGDITINGGIVNTIGKATNTEVGIGFGIKTETSGNIAINGGTVTASADIGTPTGEFSENGSGIAIPRDSSGKVIVGSKMVVLSDGYNPPKTVLSNDDTLTEKLRGRPYTFVSAKPDSEKGETSAEPINSDTPKTGFVTDKPTLQMAVYPALTADERKDVSNGASLSIGMTYEKKAAASTEDIGQALEKVVSESKSRKIGYYLDLKMYVKVGNATERMVTDLAQNIIISTVIPEDIAAANGNFGIVRYHNGEAKELESSYDAETRTLSFVTDGFSDYAVIMSEKSPATGIVDNTNIAVALALISLAVGFCAVVMLRRRSKV